GAGGRSGSNTWTNSDIREVGSGRVAMRQALKSAIKRTFDDTSAPEFEGPRTPPSDTAFAQRVTTPPGQKPLVEDTRPASRHSLPPDPPPPRAVRDATLPPVHTPALQSAVPDTTRRAPAPPTAAHLDDPNWTLSEFRGNSYLDVCWNSVDAFALDAYGQMLACTLTLRTSDRPLPFQAPILMVLRHGTMVVQCEATVLEHGPDHAIYRLKLDPGQISEIRRSAETSSVISGAMDHAKRR
ncbi:MAG: hypothetical protein FJ090_19780, partial [Deltaproteobacteria bacterium]|nr:hypothetical protein [Deltaproteobacteria bacterium]